MIRKKSLSYFILFGMEASIQAWVRFTDFIYNPSYYAYSNYPRKLNYGAMYQALKDLREKGYIEITKDEEGKILVKLTESGKEKVLIQKLLENKRWDKKWRIVIWDIPEKHRKLRDLLRRKLKEWEFTQWQKSVWVSKKDIIQPLKRFLNEVGLSQWVKVILAEDI